MLVRDYRTNDLGERLQGLAGAFQRAGSPLDRSALQDRLTGLQGTLTGFRAQVTELLGPVDPGSPGVLRGIPGSLAPKDPRWRAVMRWRHCQKQIEHHERILQAMGGRSVFFPRWEAHEGWIICGCKDLTPLVIHPSGLFHHPERTFYRVRPIHMESAVISGWAEAHELRDRLGAGLCPVGLVRDKLFGPDEADEVTEKLREVFSVTPQEARDQELVEARDRLNHELFRTVKNPLFSELAVWRLALHGEVAAGTIASFYGRPVAINRSTRTDGLDTVVAAPFPKNLDFYVNEAIRMTLMEVLADTYQGLLDTWGTRVRAHGWFHDTLVVSVDRQDDPGAEALLGALRWDRRFPIVWRVTDDQDLITRRTEARP